MAIAFVINSFGYCCLWLASMASHQQLYIFPLFLGSSFLGFCHKWLITFLSLQFKCYFLRKTFCIISWVALFSPSPIIRFLSLEYKLSEAGDFICSCQHFMYVLFYGKYLMSFGWLNNWKNKCTITVISGVNFYWLNLFYVFKRVEFIIISLGKGNEGKRTPWISIYFVKSFISLCVNIHILHMYTYIYV